MVERETSRRIVDGVNTSIKNYRKKIQSAIDSHKEQAKQVRSDNIARLKEALLIAEELNITQPSDAHLTNQTIVMDHSSVSGPTQITEMPLYLFGTDALSTQIEILQNRVSDDPFIPNLRSLEAELNTTSLVKVNYSDVRVAEIDQKALAPTRKYSPRRSLILILGLFFGIVVSFFYLLVVHAKK
jgi:chain length determinant protein (polysaccharide antigen chain regulator)